MKSAADPDRVLGIDYELAAGVDATAKVYPGAPHSFTEAASASTIVREAVDDGARWLQETLT